MCTQRRRAVAFYVRSRPIQRYSIEAPTMGESEMFCKKGQLSFTYTFRNGTSFGGKGSSQPVLSFFPSGPYLPPRIHTVYPTTVLVCDLKQWIGKAPHTGALDQYMDEMGAMASLN